LVWVLFVCLFILLLLLIFLTESNLEKKHNTYISICTWLITLYIYIYSCNA
jgi:hypothetical protein